MCLFMILNYLHHVSYLRTNKELPDTALGSLFIPLRLTFTRMLVYRRGGSLLVLDAFLLYGPGGLLEMCTSANGLPIAASSTLRSREQSFGIVQIAFYIISSYKNGRYLRRRL